MSQRKTTITADVSPPAFLAFWLGLVVYGWIFFTASPERLGCLQMLLLPDEIAFSWIGGDFAKFGPWDRIPVLLEAGALWGMAFIAGRLTLRGISADRGLNRLETVVFSLGAGLSELSLLTLILGLAGALRCPWAFLAVFLVIGVFFVRCWRRGDFRVASNETADSEARESVDSFIRYGLMWGLPFLLMIVLGGMMPPWDFDVREYHLQVPKEWYQQGRITFLPHNVYGNMPLGAEMHALLGMVFWPGKLGWWWGAMVGKTVMASFAPLTSLALLAAGERLQRSVAGTVAALVYISTPWVVQVSVAGLNEPALACYTALATYAALLWSFGPGNPESTGSAARVRGWLLLSGFFAGSAVACKYPAVLFLMLPLWAWVSFCSRRFDGKSAVLFGAAAVCACGPWLAKNAVLADNPVYPLVFGGRTRTTDRMERWNGAHRVPVDATGHRYSVAAAVEAVSRIGWQSTWQSPLVLPLAALAFASRRQRRLARWLGMFCLYLLAVWWLLTHRIDRFWLPVLPLLSMLAGQGAAACWAGRRKTSLIFVLSAGLAWCCLLLLTASQDSRYLVSLAELRRGDPAAPGLPPRVNPVHRWLNQAVPPRHCVLLVGDAEPFDLEVPAMYSTCFDENLLEQLLRLPTPQQRLDALKAHKISHVYVRWSEIDRYRSPGNYGFADNITRRLVRNELVDQQGILQPIDLGLNPDTDQVFAVTDSPRISEVRDSASPALPK